MNITKALNLGSAVIGVVGTVLMYKGTFGLVVSGSFMGTAADPATKSANDHRTALQRAGLVLLTLSFALQGIAQFTPP